ncbi:MAG: sensor histidine kinase [Microbacteriaceae bacterium]
MAFAGHIVLNSGVAEQAGSPYLAMVLFAALLLFLWRPPIAAIACLVAVAVATALGDGAPHALALCAVAGLVSYTCSSLLTMGFCIATLGLIIGAEFSGGGFAVGGSLAAAAVMAAATAVGAGMRLSRQRERDLSEANKRLAQETAAALQAERDRIADELHNIIAHDLTVVAVQSRAVKLMSDSEQRTAALAAIADSASQALKDIRRMLLVVQGADCAAGDRDEQRTGVTGALQQVAETLRAMRMRVAVDAPDSIVVSCAVAATLRHVLMECATNALKHGDAEGEARISIAADEDSVHLEFWNTVTRKPAESQHGPSGYGLHRMAERVEVLGGTFSAEPAPGGWLTRAGLPRS